MYSDTTVEIIEQPAPNSMRFRYPCEGKSAGSIVGVNSTEELKTYPAIRILNYSGNAVVIVSCVTDQEPYKAHPNCLVGKSCSRGVCKIDFITNAASPTIVAFPQLGIQCARRADILKNLNEREELRIDPFKAGFKHKEKTKFINLFAIRLCFQVLLKPDLSNPKRLVPVKPVASLPIYDKNRVNMNLLIHDISDQSSPPCGNKKIMLFTDKIEKRDILVRFFEEDSKGTVVWEDWGVFKESNVHKQFGISFKTPKYKNQDIDVPVNVFFHLRRRSDGVSSNIIPFQYVPDVTNISSSVNTKKRKIDNSKALYEYLQIHEADGRQKPKMTSNINPNESLQNIGAGAAGACAAASNFCVPTQHQHPNHEPLHQQDYQWPQQNSQYEHEQSVQSNHDRYHQQPHSEHPQYHNSQYRAPHYNIQPEQPEAKVDTRRENCLSSCPANYYSDSRHFYGAAANIDQHHINNAMAMPLSNHNTIADIRQMQMPFCSNNLSFNQQPATEVVNSLISNFDPNV